MKSKKYGEEIGRITGHYNEYGGVIENEYYRGDGETYANGKPNKNSHKEICESEMQLPDSNAFGRKFVLPDGRTYERDTYSVGIDYFENMMQRFPSFSENFTPEIENTLAEYAKIKEMRFSGLRTKRTIAPEEKQYLGMYLKFSMRMPEDLQLYFNNWIDGLPPFIP